MRNLLLVAAVALALLGAAAPSAVAASPGECLDDGPDADDCVARHAKCLLRERVGFLYRCWGILGP